MLGLKTPDITLAQIVAAVGWVGAQLVAMGLIDDSTNQLVVMVASTGVTAAWTIADAIIRQGRAKAAAATHIASAAASGSGPNAVATNL